MEMIFEGHDYRYAVEQSLLAFFPNERPVYGEEESNRARVSLTVEGQAGTAVTELSVEGRTARGRAQAALSGAEDEHARERLLQRAVKLSFLDRKSVV